MLRDGMIVIPPRSLFFNDLMTNSQCDLLEILRTVDSMTWKTILSKLATQFSCFFFHHIQVTIRFPIATIIQILKCGRIAVKNNKTVPYARVYMYSQTHTHNCFISNDYYLIVGFRFIFQFYILSVSFKIQIHSTSEFQNLTLLLYNIYFSSYELVLMDKLQYEREGLTC